MKPEDVPDEMVEHAAHAYIQAPGDPYFLDRLRIALAAAWPEIEATVRASVADEIANRRCDFGACDVCQCRREDALKAKGLRSPEQSGGPPNDGITAADIASAEHRPAGTATERLDAKEGS